MFSRTSKSIGVYVSVVVLMLTWFQVVAAQETAEGAAAADPSMAASAVDENFILRAYDVGNLLITIKDRPFSDSLPRHAFGGDDSANEGGGFFSVPEDASRLGAMASRGGTFRFAQFGGGLSGRGGGEFGGGGGLGGGGRGGMAMGGETSPRDDGSAQSITIAELLWVITATVVPDSWEVNGGDGRIEPLGTRLVVWQDPKVHDRIGELLRQLEQQAAEHRTVTVDARWLKLTSDELENLIVADQKDGVPQADRDHLAKFSRRPDTLRGVTNCLSGQLVYIVSGTMKNIVSGYIPVVGSNESPDREVQLVGGLGTGGWGIGRASGVSSGLSPARVRIQFINETVPATVGARGSVGYQPIVQTTNIGALLEIRPTLVSGGSVMVDLKSTVTAEGDAERSADLKAAGVGIAPVVDRVAIETLEFAGTLRMPLKKPVLVGGLTYSPSARGEDKAELTGGEIAAVERPQLYLVLEVK